MAKTVYEKTMERALRLLSFKPRTIAEMRTRLLEKDWTDETAADSVIDQLKELGYLNDEQFAANFAHSRLTMKPLGPVRLRRDLQRKKLSAQTVENALTNAYEEHDQESLVEQALQKRVRLKGVPNSPEEAKKLFDYLMRRGFSYELIRRKLRDLAKNLEIREDE